MYIKKKNWLGVQEFELYAVAIIKKKGQTSCIMVE